MKYSFIYGSLGIVLGFLLCAYYHTSFNVMAWGQDGRLMNMFLSFCFGLVGGIIGTQKKSK